MQWSELEEQPCSIARTLSVIGDRWTLMILRECFLRVRRFEDFQARLGIGRPTLKDRLQTLVDAFVLTKVTYQERPLRQEYRLTQKGMDLYPILMAINHWGDVHMAGKKGPPVFHTHNRCGHDFSPMMVCSECRDELQAKEVVARPASSAKGAHQLPEILRQDTPRATGRPR